MYDEGSVSSFDSHFANFCDRHKISTLINITVRDEIIHRQRKFWLIMHQKVNILPICKSTFRRPYTSIYHTFVCCHRFVIQLTSLSNCEILLQIKQNIDASLTVDIGESKTMRSNDRGKHP